MISTHHRDDTFSLIPKLNILNKLFPEIKFLIIILRILLRIVFTQINHPLAIGLILLIQTPLISLTSSVALSLQ
jgi:hypothetical protein